MFTPNCNVYPDISSEISFPGEGNDYLNVAIKDGCLSLTMGLANGKQEMQIKPNKVRFDDNQWHKVSIHRRIQEVSLYASDSELFASWYFLCSIKVFALGSVERIQVIFVICFFRFPPSRAFVG